MRWRWLAAWGSRSPGTAARRAGRELFASLRPAPAGWNNRSCCGPGRCGPPLSAEVECWRQVHQRGRACRIDDTDRIVRGWPVHEPDWKREITRLELPDEGCFD